MNTNSQHISISSGTIFRFFAIGLGVAAFFYFREFVILIVTAVILASAIEMPIQWMGKYKIPRLGAVSIIYLICFSIVLVVGLFVIPQIADDLAKFISTLPKLLESVRVFGRDLGFKDLALQVQELSRDISKGQILTVIQTAFLGSSGFFQTTGVVLHGIINTVLVVVLSFYFAAEERGVQRFLHLVLPKEYEPYVENIWNRAQRKIGLWMQGQFILSFMVGTMVLIPLLIIDMPYAPFLATLVFFGEFVPIVGLTFATLPALFIAFTTGGAELLLIVAIIYFVISQLEGNVLYPKVMNRMVGVPSVIIIIALVIGLQLAGFWGVLLSVPVAAILMELINDAQKTK